jgi:hypothetical protein
MPQTPVSELLKAHRERSHESDGVTPERSADHVSQRPLNPALEKAWELYVEAEKEWYKVASNTSYGFNGNPNNRAAAMLAQERSMTSLSKARDIKLMDYYIEFDKDQLEVFGE